MNDLKWFRFVEILRYGFDIARIFPIIINHRGASRLLSGIYSHIASRQAYWQSLLNLDYHLHNISSGLSKVVLETIL